VTRISAWTWLKWPRAAQSLERHEVGFLTAGLEELIPEVVPERVRVHPRDARLV
jgi:hypothetical protein